MIINTLRKYWLFIITIIFIITAFFIEQKVYNIDSHRIVTKRLQENLIKSKEELNTYLDEISTNISEKNSTTSLNIREKNG